MTKTIKLNASANLEYQKQLKSLSKYFTKVEQKLLLKGADLALLDKWKGAHKNGEIFTLDVNSLRGTGDPNIDKIIEVIDIILYAKKQIGEH